MNFKNFCIFALLSTLIIGSPFLASYQYQIHLSFLIDKYTMPSVNMTKMHTKCEQRGGIAYLLTTRENPRIQILMCKNSEAFVYEPIKHSFVKLEDILAI